MIVSLTSRMLKIPRFYLVAAFLALFSLPGAQAQINTLASFNLSDGATPKTGLTLSGNTLYGTTEFGGASNYGAVFSVPLSGGTPTLLGSIIGSNGQYPAAGLTLSGNTLYPRQLQWIKREPSLCGTHLDRKHLLRDDRRWRGQ